MNKYLLTVLLTTHHFNLIHEATILHAIQVAKEHPDTLQLIIADNSNIALKQNKLIDLTRTDDNIFVIDTYNSEDNSFFNNVIDSIKYIDGQYVMLMGDDDIIIQSGISDVIENIKNKDIDYNVIMPPIALDNPKGLSIYKYSNLNSNQLDERIHGLLLPDQTNYTFFAIVKKDLFTSAFIFWKDLPNLQSYHDHIFTLFYILNGSLLQLDKAHYIYNTSNWSTQKVSSESALKHLKNLKKLPISMTLVQRLLNGFEGLFLLEKLHQNNPKLKQACNIWISVWFQNWKIQTSYELDNLRGELLSCPKIPTVIDFISNYMSIESIDTMKILHDCANFYERINGSGTLYFDFWNNKF